VIEAVANPPRAFRLNDLFKLNAYPIFPGEDMALV